MKVGFLLLCHEKPAQLARLLGSPYFRHPDAKLYVHQDLAAGSGASLRGVLGEGVNAIFIEPRLHCRWGEYSLVSATARLIEAALNDATFRPDYLFLISGSCFPIRPFASLQEFLRRRRGFEFIQAHDIETRPWVVGGLDRERYTYYFPFNFKSHRKLFEQSLKWQRRLKIRRERPAGLNIHFGSQWFCITAEAGRAVLARLADKRIERFFRHSWIPDEFAIQSIVATDIGGARITDHSLTYYEFNPNGRPLVFHNDHLEHLTHQPFFFARKISPSASRLTAALEARIAQPEPDLSYFETVGTPSPDVQLFLARASHDPDRRSWIGAIEDYWRGLIDLSDRRYLVFTGRDRAWVSFITRTLREEMGVPCFDFPFDPGHFVPAEGRLSYGGFRPDDMGRRDYDVSSFLVEMVHSFPNTVCFGLDAAYQTRVRELVRWDHNATVLICDPPRGWNESQALAARALGREGAAYLAEALQAKRKHRWLPEEFFREARQSGKHSARILDLSWNLPTDLPYRDQLQRILGKASALDVAA